MENVRDILNAGADKVVIKTETIKRPKFITEAAHISKYFPMINQ